MYLKVVKRNISTIEKVLTKHRNYFRRTTLRIAASVKDINRTTLIELSNRLRRKLLFTVPSGNVLMNKPRCTKNNLASQIKIKTMCKVPGAGVNRQPTNNIDEACNFFHTIYLRCCPLHYITNVSLADTSRPSFGCAHLF